MIYKKQWCCHSHVFPPTDASHIAAEQRDGDLTSVHQLCKSVLLFHSAVCFLLCWITLFYPLSLFLLSCSTWEKHPCEVNLLCNFHNNSLVFIDNSHSGNISILSFTAFPLFPPHWWATWSLSPSLLRSLCLFCVCFSAIDGLFPLWETQRVAQGAAG